MQQVHRLRLIDVVMSRRHPVRHCDQHRNGNGKHDIAEDGRRLAADGPRNQRGERFEIVRRAAARIDDSRNRMNRHGRLLGGDGPVQNMDQHEAEPVVQAESDGLVERRPVGHAQRNLDGRHEGDDKAGTKCGLEQREVVETASRDVVFAAVA